MARSETISIRLTPEERRLLERVVDNSPQGSLADWFRARLYDEGWRLVFQGDDMLYEVRDGLEYELLLSSLAGGRWFDVQLVRESEESEVVVSRFIGEFLPEQLARLAGLPRGVGVEEAVRRLQELAEGGGGAE